MSRYTVLYADDDPDDLELVQESFELYSNNIEVILFNDGGQVLEFLNNLPDAQSNPCLVILDINMPVLSGKEVLAELRNQSRYQFIPVVLFTTSSQPLDKLFAQHYNAGFITKPIGIKEMHLIINQFINQCEDEVQKNIRIALSEGN